MVNKKVLRQVYLEKRLSLTQAEYQYRNELIQEQITKHLNLSSAKVAHIFLSITKQKEIDTLPIITLLEHEYPSLKIAVSKTMPRRELVHFILNKDTKLEISSWGIPEPATGQQIAAEEIDIVFVPLIVCDKRGYRIGYGGGYYDIFLSKIPEAKKIGLSISPLLDQIPYIESFDVPLDSCVTPFGTHSFEPLIPKTQ